MSQIILDTRVTNGHLKLQDIPLADETEVRDESVFGYQCAVVDSIQEVIQSLDKKTKKLLNSLLKYSPIIPLMNRPFSIWNGSLRFL